MEFIRDPGFNEVMKVIWRCGRRISCVAPLLKSKWSVMAENGTVKKMTISITDDDSLIAHLVYCLKLQTLRQPTMTLSRT